MAVQLFTNNASSTLASGIANSATSLTLATGTGALFPTPTGGDWFLLTLTQVATETSWEIVKCTARSTDTLTIVRAQEGTTAAAWSNAAKAELRVTAGSLLPASLGAVGLTDTQTLTNKTLTSPVVNTPTVTGTKETKVAVAASAIDLATGNYFTKTATGALTWTVSNVPTTGTAVTLILDLTNGGTGGQTLWSGMKWVGGTAPTLTTAGRDVLGFFTHDGGTTWTGLLLGKDVK